LQKGNYWILNKIINNCKDSDIFDDSSQGYYSDMSPENISMPTSSESEDDICSEAGSGIQYGTWTKQEHRGLILVEENK